MAYFNIQLLYSKGLTLEDLLTIQLISQNSIEDRGTDIEGRDISRLNPNFLTTIKGATKKQSESSRLRLNKSGKELYRQLQIRNIVEEDIQLFNYIAKIWTDLEKPIGNKLACQRSIASLITESGFNRRSVFNVIKDYYIPEQLEKESGKYIPKLENFLWKPSNNYSTTFKLQESPIFSYIDELINNN